LLREGDCVFVFGYYLRQHDGSPLRAADGAVRQLTN
jgi:hypothetical protein